MLDRLAPAVAGLTGRLLVGLSGGADSVALMQLLLYTAQASGAKCCAVHVNHGLRGQAADEDEAFVRRYCAKNGVPLAVYHLSPPQHASEDWARNARYDAFRRAMSEMQADALVLAHHRDDQAETLLMHLLRGSGMRGLCGMQRESVQQGMRIIRPLLNVSRNELRELLALQLQHWREDATNATDVYLRNRVRMDAMPLLERLAPGAVTRIAQTATSLQEDDQALEQLADEWLAAHGAPDWLPLSALAKQPSGLQKRILRRWLADNTGRVPDAKHTLQAAQMLHGHAGQQCMLRGGLRLYRGWHCLHLTGQENASPEERTIDGCGLYHMGEAEIEIVSGGIDCGNGRTEQEIPAAALQDCVLRTWRTGDWIRPFGMAGRQSMQDYFVNRHVDEPFRRLVPLVCRGNEVLLACGVGAGSIPRWINGEDNLRIIVRGKMPWHNE